MRILALLSEPPWPPHSGYRIRCWELLRRLAERHEVRLVCLDRGEPAGAGPWKDAFASVRLVAGGRTTGGSLLLSLADGAPHHARRHAGAALRRAVAEEASRCDVIVAHYLYFARALRGLPGPRPALALDQHNVDHQTWESHAQAARGALRWWLRGQARRVRADEVRNLPLFDAIFSVSEEDAQVTRSLAGDRPLVVVAPNAADCSRFRPVPRQREGTTVLFSGTNARRNVEGLAWFLRECWPAVRTAVPRARLLVAGRIEARDVPAHAPDETGVTFTGERESLTEAFDAADLAIVPVALGGGTKIKTFEALASGVPVVALSAPARGSCCTSDNGVLAQSEPSAYAAAVSRLLQDTPLRLRLGEAGRRHAEQAHDWGHVAVRVGGVLERLTERFRAVSPSPDPKGTERGVPA